MTNAPIGAPSLRGAVDLSSLVRPPAGASGGADGGAPSTGSGRIVQQVTDATFSVVLDLSSVVPVIVEFFGAGIQPSLAPIVESYGGRLALATIDGAANPQLAQAFQVQEVPTVAAVVGGRPLQLFTGMMPETELRKVLDQVLELAAQNGVTGTLPGVEAGDGEAAEPEEEPLPPLHQEAYDAIIASDFPAAIKAYETAIAQNPATSSRSPVSRKSPCSPDLPVRQRMPCVRAPRPTRRTSTLNSPSPTSTSQADTSTTHSRACSTCSRRSTLRARTPCARAFSSSSRSPVPRTRGSLSRVVA